VLLLSPLQFPTAAADPQGHGAKQLLQSCCGHISSLHPFNCCCALLLLLPLQFLTADAEPLGHGAKQLPTLAAFTS
jgi:hypothetical protein